jgi:hypothetical protein
MKQPATSPNRQLCLPMLSAPATVMPEDEEKDLILALIELLMAAAREGGEPHSKTGGGDESEAHC